MNEHTDFYGLSPREGDISSREAGTDRIQSRIAEKVRGAADSLFGNARDVTTPGAPATFESQARHWLKSSADYIEKIEPQKINADISEQIRRNPGRSLLVAGAAGLILGALFRRR